MSVMTSSSSSASRLWMGAAVLLFFIWSLWSLDMQAVKSVVDTTLFEQTVVSSTGKPVSESEKPTISSASTTTSQPEFEVPTIQTISERPLILYAYSESPTAPQNLAFFLAHGLHSAADFLFIFNGFSDAITLIPEMSNIRSVERPNDCYDLGAYAEVLLKNDLYKSYKHFIMLNASIRGPFLPHWAEGCWSDMYLNKVTDEVKLVGMTANCYPTFHVQSMIWATDITGLEILLFPPESVLSEIAENPIRIPSDAPFSSGAETDVLLPTGMNKCFHDWASAVRAEISSTSLIEGAGYKVDVMMAAYHADAKYEERCNTKKNGDVLWDGKYFGTNVHVFETIFMKSNRDVDPVGLERQTEWARGSGYKSWDVCGKGQGLRQSGYMKRGKR